MTKEEILDYAMNTPNNTNRMVLNDMLDELQTSSGGASVFTVTFTPTNEDWTAFTADKTIDEIEAAYEEGAVIQGRYGTNDGYYMLNLNHIGGGSASFEIVMIYSEMQLLSYMRLAVHSGGVNCFTSDFELTPWTAPTVN